MEVGVEIADIRLPSDPTGAGPAPSLLENANTEAQISPDVFAGQTPSNPPEEADEVVAEAATPGESLALGLVAASPVSEVEAQPEWTEHRVVKGDSLARIFDRQGLDARLLHRIVNSSKEAKSLAQIRPGQTLRFQFDENR